MFKKLIDSIQQALKGRDPFDPSVFNDPVAEATDWHPAKSGGSSFGTHKMKRVSKTRIEFKTTLGGKLFSGLFAIIGLGILIGGAVLFFTQPNPPPPPALIMMGFMGVIFSLVGIGLFYHMTTPTVLDAKLGLYWKGRKDPSLPGNRDALKICVELSDIHAIQLLAERCSGGGKNSSSYWSYELNFVLTNGDRVNVVDHGNLDRIREEADILSGILDIPLWDAT